MVPAPIALFVYNRLDHTRRTVEALARNELASESHLHVFSDGPRTPADTAQVAAVRSYLGKVTGFESVEITPRAHNLGLANSIISGVTEICRKHGRVIVLEDDLLTSPYFLRYMNEALELYQADPEVASVHAYLYPTQARLPETFFIKGTNCWGWGTWSRAWELFNPNGQELLAQLEEQNLTHSFDLEGAYGYTAMLRQQIAGINDSWAVRWHASAFLKNKLTLYSGRSLVHNIGNDGTGFHSIATKAFEVALAKQPIHCARIPITEDTNARREIAISMRKLRTEPENPIIQTSKHLLKLLLPSFVWNLAKRLRTQPTQTK